MKIVVLSDTHGHINTAMSIIEQQKPDMIIHLGDLIRDARDLENMYGIRTEYIAGNNDFYDNAPLEKTLIIEGKKVLITHGHKYRVKYGLEDIAAKAQKEGVECVLFGHTHEPCECFDNNILLFNPGSLTLPRNKRSYGLLEIKNNNIYEMVCEL